MMTIIANLVLAVLLAIFLEPRRPTKQMIKQKQLEIEKQQAERRYWLWYIDRFKRSWAKKESK